MTHMDSYMTKKNKYIAIALLAGFLYRMLLSLQGIDHIDLGFSNTFYQNIFTHPESMTFYFNYYLAGLLGGTWYHWFSATGLLGFRFLEALTLTASIFLVYKTFERQLTNTRAAILAILMSFLFPSIVTTLHYNTLTFFFLSLAAWCYSKSLYDKQLLWTYLSGLALGFCFFVRIVNAALGILILIPVIYAFATHQRKLAFQLGGVMLAGMLSACIAMLGVMATLGHLPYFLAGLNEAFGFFSSGETSHSSSNLFLVYFKGYVNIILQILAIFGLGALYLQSSRLTSKWGLALRIFLIVASIVLIATSLPYLSAIALYTLLCTPIFYAITPKEDKLIAAFVIAGTYVFPFGSDIGIAGIYHWTGALLIIPAAAGAYHTSRIVRRGVLICSLYIACIMLWKALSYAYGEQTPRWTCTERIGNNVLNTFTSPEKADDYRHIIACIRENTADNHWLVLGNQSSEIFYATETKPFIGNTQLGTFTGEALTRVLDNRLQQYQQRPVVVFLNKEHFVFDEAEEVQEQLKQWMSLHDYQMIHHDAYLTIYK